MVYCTFYDTESCSMYKNSSAIAIPGNTMPTKGTKIDGRYDAVIFLV